MLERLILMCLSLIVSVAFGGSAVASPNKDAQSLVERNYAEIKKMVDDIDVDQDGYTNKCEEKWYTNPREPTSFPGQGQHCDNFE